MYFYLAKILGFFAIPSNLVIMIGLTGVVLARTRFSRFGWGLAIDSLLVLAVIGFTPVGNALIIPLEQRFPPWDPARGAPAGIIVLGGAVSADVAATRNDTALNESAERMTAAAELARRYPQAKIIFSGGSPALIRNEPPEAESAVRLLERLGVAPGRVVAENRSRNTVENALFSKELAKPKAGERWILVTSAYHMPRSIGVFRRAGFAVEAYPVDWRTRGREDMLRPFATLGDGIRRTDTAVREWIALVIYWLTGRSSELFPGPLAVGGCDLARAADNCRP